MRQRGWTASNLASRASPGGLVSRTTGKGRRTLPVAGCRRRHRACGLANGRGSRHETATSPPRLWGFAAAPGWGKLWQTREATDARSHPTWRRRGDAQGVVRCDVAIKGETIAAVTSCGTLPDSDGVRVIEAAGKIVMPGGIDPHVHMQHPFLAPDGTILYTRGIDQVGKAALFGGTTTLIDFAYVTGERSVRRSIEARDADFAPKSCCDWAYHMMLSTDPAAPAVRPTRRGDAGRLSDHQDLHDQHPAERNAAAWSIRRHLGSVQGRGKGGRHRVHPCRGQRHRHAHVREADRARAASASSTWRRCTTRCRRSCRSAA